MDVHRELGGLCTYLTASESNVFNDLPLKLVVWIVIVKRAQKFEILKCFKQWMLWMNEFSALVEGPSKYLIGLLNFGGRILSAIGTVMLVQVGFISQKFSFFTGRNVKLQYNMFFRFVSVFPGLQCRLIQIVLTSHAGTTQGRAKVRDKFRNRHAH